MAGSAPTSDVRPPGRSFPCGEPSMSARARRWPNGGRISAACLGLALVPFAWVAACAVGVIAAPHEVSSSAGLGAGWGADHVGAPTPEYATGDECLFCHRDR